jgi:hypothetical protein
MKLSVLFLSLLTAIASATVANQENESLDKTSLPASKDYDFLVKLEALDTHRKLEDSDEDFFDSFRDRVEDRRDRRGDIRDAVDDFEDFFEGENFRDRIDDDA